DEGRSGRRLVEVVVVLYGAAEHGDAHSFPTRRSSDLVHTRDVEEDDGRQDAEDGNDDKKFDQRETTLAASRALACAVEKFEQHQDRKSTRLNSSHVASPYAVYCVKAHTAESQPRDNRA